MGRQPNTGKLNLGEAFARVQKGMLAHLSVGSMIDHSAIVGTASEQLWLQLFERYLPRRYRAAPAFVVDSRGNRSRQIDLVVFDNLYSPLLFPHESALHVPAEGVYAVFEIKSYFSHHHIDYAAEKAASVRALKRTSVRVMVGGKKRDAARVQPILAGLLATSFDWPKPEFEGSLRRALMRVKPAERLDLGCSLDGGAFEYRAGRPIRIAPAEEALLFFLVRLLARLQAGGTAPAADLGAYLKNAKSGGEAERPVDTLPAGERRI
jgi:hypothetical protein